MMLMPVRITRATKCKEGFYLLVNGERIHFKRKADAVAGLEAIMAMQRFQIVTVREYADRNATRIKREGRL